MHPVVKYIVKAILQGIVISIVITTVMIGIDMLFGRALVFNRNLAIEVGYYMIYGVTLTVLNGGYFDYLNSRVRWEKFSRYRILIGATGSVLLTMAGVFLIRLFINIVLEGESLQDFLNNEKPQYYVISLLITMIISLFFHAFYFYKKIQENKVREQQIIAGTASAQFESLKNQIDPHFLFNSLNVLSSLIEENPENAQRFTTSLSKIYRYVLEQKDKELVSLEEELKFAKTYMNLLKMRFENSLFYKLPDVIPNPDAKVVPLSLQLLLENTVKHNIVSEQKPLHIDIFIDGDYLNIRNNFQKKEVLQDRKGVGLQNIVSRYAIITNRKVLIDQQPESFTVSIPVLTRQVLAVDSQYKNAEDQYYRVQKKVEDIKGFYGNLSSYIIVITGLAILNIATNPDYFWFLFPAIGWGIGVLIHGLHVFNYMPFLGRDWEERKIRELIEREKSERWE
jgi:hypothetical protein